MKDDHRGCVFDGECPGQNLDGRIGVYVNVPLHGRPARKVSLVARQMDFG
jgi:hypothetical protein